ncbi:MAG TPA: hypothetical protein DEO84_05835 [candidate division Zixibacteria bacterium]|nr:hypothetical protein [candidate division Zixibacteria bacterium]HBZ00826.1 hypothetical protein [candidate division Zixibacteria bacterium]
MFLDKLKRNGMQRTNKRNIILSQSYYSLMIVLFLFSLLACSQSSSRKAVVASYERAYNAHQVDSLLVLFTENAQYEFTGMETPLVGKEAIAEKARYDSTLDSQIKLIIERTKRDTVFVNAMESNNWLFTAGLQPNVYSSIAFVIVNGKIKRVRAELSEPSVAAINAVMGALIPWAQENEPEKLGRLLSGGGFAYNRESAVLSLELLDNWHQANRIH